MADNRRIEVFSAGCALCNEVVDTVRREAGPSDDAAVKNMQRLRALRLERDTKEEKRRSQAEDGAVARLRGGNV